MKGIDTSTAVPDMFGPGAAGFRDGDPLSGTPATRLNAGWFNGVQQELLNAITDAGLSPDANDLTQLAQAIRSRVGKHVGEVFHYPGRTPPFGAVVADGGLVRRDMYPDLWAYAQDQNMVIAEAAWQTQNSSQGSVGMYSAGDGVTTFRLPLLTDFFRGTKDPEKVGTWQGDAIRNIKAGVGTGHIYPFANASGSFVVSTPGNLQGTPLASASNLYAGLSFDASKTVPTAEENRPKTLFLLPCIHAYNAVIPDAQADMHALLLALNNKLDKVTYNNCPVFFAPIPASSIPAATYTRIPLSTPAIDTHGSHSNGNFQPKVPGTYLITASYMGLTVAASGTHHVSAPKNGGIGMIIGGGAMGPSGGSSVSAIMQMNGTTDYVSYYIYSNVASTVSNSYGLLQAFLIRGV